jgi:hypothetical protein
MTVFPMTVFPMTVFPMTVFPMTVFPMTVFPMTASAPQRAPTSIALSQQLLAGTAQTGRFRLLSRGSVLIRGFLLYLFPPTDLSCDPVALSSHSASR